MGKMLSIRGFFAARARTALYAAAAMLPMLPSAALADPSSSSADTVGAMMCKVYTQLNTGSGSSGLVSLFVMVAYILGAVFIGLGLYKFKEWADSPGRPPLHHAIAHCVGGVALLSFPSMTGWIFATLYLTPGGGGLSTCTAGSVTSSSSTTDISQMFINLVNNFKDPLTMLVSVLGYTIGAFLMIRGFVKLSKFGTDPRAHSMSAILANLVFGAAIFSIGTSASLVMGTVFGTTTMMDAASANVTSWKMVTAFGTNATQFAATVTAVIQFFRVIGAIAFLRGWLVLKNATEGGGQASMTAGFTHIIGGIMAMNMFYMLKLVDKTLGSNFL